MGVTLRLFSIKNYLKSMMKSSVMSNVLDSKPTVYRQAYRHNFKHSRCTSNSSGSRTQLTENCESSETPCEPTLHKVQTVTDLRRVVGLKPHRYSQRNSLVGRPFDLIEELGGWSPVQLENSAKQPEECSLGVNSLVTLMIENSRLKAQNCHLKLSLEATNTELQSLRSLLSVHSSPEYNILKQERNELLMGFEQVCRQLDQKRLLLEDARQENRRVKEVAQKLTSEVDNLTTQLAVKEKDIGEMRKQMETLYESYSKVKQEFTQLRVLVEEDNKQWELYKEMWIFEKEYYKEIIRKLEFELECRKERK